MAGGKNPSTFFNSCWAPDALVHSSPTRKTSLLPPYPEDSPLRFRPLGSFRPPPSLLSLDFCYQKDPCEERNQKNKERRDFYDKNEKRLDFCTIVTVVFDLNRATGRQCPKMGSSAPEMVPTVIYTASDTFDSSTIFHTIYDVVAFVLYMHQQIPSTVQDMNIEFDSLHSEYKQLEMDLGSEVKASCRRQHMSKMREIKVGIKRLDKFMSSLSSLQTALKVMINEVSTIDGVILALGGTTLRPLNVYELEFPRGISVSKDDNDFARSKAAEGLSRKAIRTLISKGAGSVAYPGPIKLFVLVKAPSSFNQPLHFLPKRDFRYNRKVVPLKILFKCRNQDQEVSTSKSEDLIWFQCRHVIKGLAMNVIPEE